MTEKKKKVLSIAAIAVFVIFMALVTWLVGGPIVEFAKQPEKFREWVEGYGSAGKLLFFGMMVLQTIVAFIPGEPMEIVAGYAFGTIPGTLLCIFGQAAGSILVFLFVRRFGVKLVEVFFSREKINSLKFLNDEKKLKAFVFFVFLMPGTPKDVLAYCVGLTKLALSEWIFISLFARIPAIITSTVGGNALGVGDHTFAVIVFAVTIAVSVAGYVVYNKIVALRAKHAEEKLARKKDKKAKKSLKSKTRRANLNSRMRSGRKTLRYRRARKQTASEQKSA